jgi:hypothetical protein
MNGLGLAAVVLVVLAIFAAAVALDHQASRRRPSPAQPEEEVE